jgi:hypothetical protein
MEYEFTYSNIPTKMKYNKIVAIDALDIKCLYKTADQKYLESFEMCAGEGWKRSVGPIM